MIPGFGSANRSRIVVTGASGKLGPHICLALADHFDVIAVSHTGKLHAELAEYRVSLDLTDLALVNALLDNMQPQAILHAAAFSDPNSCQQQPEISLRLNAALTKELAQLAANRDMGFICISTDLVFDGEQGHYQESDPVNPINLYGEHKALAEQLATEVHPCPLILRCPWMFGKQNGGQGNIQQWQATLQSGSGLLGFTDEFRSPVSFSVAAAGIAHLTLSYEETRRSVTLEGADIYHLGGIETVSRYHLLVQLAKLLGCDPRLVHAASQKTQIMPAKRPADVSLDSRKARNAGYKTPFLSAILKSTLDS